MHCWEILRDEPKWNDRMLELNNTSTPCTKARQGTSSTDAIPIHGESKTQDDHLKRPEGRDSAKKKRSRAMDATSASSTAVDVLQRMQENREKNVVKQDEQLLEILTRKDENIKIQRELLDVQKRNGAT